jgi:hypothetical protein
MTRFSRIFKIKEIYKVIWLLIYLVFNMNNGRDLQVDKKNLIWHKVLLIRVLRQEQRIKAEIFAKMILLVKFKQFMIMLLI